MRSIFSISIIVIGSLLGGTAAAEQTGAGTLSGRIVDASLGGPLPGAIVLVEGTVLQAASDEEGRFQLAGVPAGDQTAVVRFLGRQTVRTPIAVLAGQTVTLAIELRDAFVLEETVTVTAGPIGDGEARALNQQKTAPNITNVVSADQIGQFPDANAAEATQRIPGISIERDQGEGRYVVIRGSEARLNSMLINGERIPSPEGDVRQVALDVVPTDLLEAIHVSKALTPDMDADAIGGAVNLVTKAAPSQARALATISGGYNDIQDDWGQGLFSVTAGRRFNGDKLGLIATASYNDVNRGSENIEPEYDDGDLDDLQVRDYSINRERTGLNAALDYQLTPNDSLFVRGIFTRFADQEYRRRTRYRVGDDRIERELKDRLETQVIGNLQAGADHFLANGLHVDYRVSASYAEEDEPDRHDTTFRQDDILFDPNVSAAFIDPDNLQANPLNENLAAFTLDDQVVENNLTTDRDIVGAFDVRLPLLLRRNFAGTLKAGVKYRDKRKTRDNSALVFESGEDLFLNDLVDPAFNVRSVLGGRYMPGAHVGPDQARQLRSRFALEAETDFEADLADYTATERTSAVYGMADLALGPAMTLLSGVRVESTRIDYTGYELLFDDAGDFASIEPVGDARDYTKVFPGVHWRYAFTPDSNLRAAVTRSMARPNFYDLVPFQLILEEDSEIVRGNATLRPTVASNVDLMVEHYFQSVGVVSGGFFYKSLTDFIFPFTFGETRNGDDFDVLEPRNGDDARVTGLELAFQNQLRALPAPFDGLGLYANYTFTDSDATLPERAADDLRLPGQARHVGNLAVWYEKRGFSARASLNFRGRALFEVADDAAEDVFLDANRQLDLSVSQALSDNLRLFVNALNLTNEPLRFYEGSPDRPMQEEFYSWWMSFGARLSY